MKIKKEFIVLAIVIVAVSLYLIAHKRDRSHYELPAVAAISKKDITKLEVAKGESQIALVRKDNLWYVDPQGFLADAEKVSRMLDALENLTLTALVSESQSYVRYDLDEQNRIQVKAWNGERLVRDIEVGKTAPSFRHTFVKPAHDKNVYHARDSFRDRFDITVADVRDKKALVFQPEDARELRISRDKQTVDFTRSQKPAEEPAADQASPSEDSSVKPLWLSSDGHKADQAKLDRLISTLSNLRCESYVEGRTKEEFTEPIYAVQLKGNEEHSLSIFAKLKEEDKKYPAVSSGNPDPFFLSESLAKRIMTDPAELIEKAPEQTSAPQTDATESTDQPSEPQTAPAQE